MEKRKKFKWFTRQKGYQIFVIKNLNFWSKNDTTFMGNQIEGYQYLFTRLGIQTIKQ